MKRLNKLLIILFSSATLLLASESMAAGPDLNKGKKKDTLEEILPMDSFGSDVLENSQVPQKRNTGADPSDSQSDNQGRCEVRNRVGVPCSDGFCDVRAGGGGGRGEHNNGDKLCKGHGGVASPST